MMTDFKERLKKLYRYGNNIPKDSDELKFVSRELFGDLVELLCELRIPLNPVQFYVAQNKVHLYITKTAPRNWRESTVYSIDGDKLCNLLGLDLS